MVQIKLTQAGTARQVARHGRQLIVTEVEAEQASKAGQSGWAGQGREAVGNGHKVFEAGELVHVVREAGEHVMADVQGAEGWEGADGRGEAGQLCTEAQFMNVQFS